MSFVTVLMEFFTKLKSTWISKEKIRLKFFLQYKS